MPIESDSEMIAKIFKAAGIIIAAPTYEYKLFPPMASALEKLEERGSQERLPSVLVLTAGLEGQKRS